MIVITDSQTNFLYLADTLPVRFPVFFENFQAVLQKACIPCELLSNTRDIWVVDYMPIQVSESRFIRFIYNPDYLRDTLKWRKIISDSGAICSALGILYEDSNILLDGGNLIRASDKLILCDKVIKENPHYSEKGLIAELERLFQVDRIIFIPTDPYDMFGHADGMVRFLDDRTVLINDYSRESEDFRLSLHMALKSARLEYLELPYNPYSNANDLDAKGIYINYLQMEQGIVLPVYGLEEDEVVLRRIEGLFPGLKIIPLKSNEIAKEGGVLNCISWNIWKT